MAKNGGSAFPVSEQFYDGDGEFRLQPISSGMTLRDYFAGQALAGVCANEGTDTAKVIGITERAYEIADAMLAKREKSI